MKKRYMHSLTVRPRSTTPTPWSRSVFGTYIFFVCVTVALLTKAKTNNYLVMKQKMSCQNQQSAIFGTQCNTSKWHCWRHFTKAYLDAAIVAMLNDTVQDDTEKVTRNQDQNKYVVTETSNNLPFPFTIFFSLLPPPVTPFLVSSILCWL